MALKKKVAISTIIIRRHCRLDQDRSAFVLDGQDPLH